MGNRILLLIAIVSLAYIDTAISEEKLIFRNGIDANYWLYLATDKYDSADWSDVAWKSGI
jgi:hypothetical protein